MCEKQLQDEERMGLRSRETEGTGTGTGGKEQWGGGRLRVVKELQGGPIVKALTQVCRWWEVRLQ